MSPTFDPMPTPPVGVPQPRVVERYTVRLYFAEPDELNPGQRVFSVDLQGKPAIEDLDLTKVAGGRLHGLMREFRDVPASDHLVIGFRGGVSVLCGVEVLRQK